MFQHRLLLTIPLLMGVVALELSGQAPPPSPEVKWLEEPKIEGSNIKLKWIAIVPPGYEIVKGFTCINRNGVNHPVPDDKSEWLLPALVGKNRIRIQVRMRPIGPPPGNGVDYMSAPKDAIYLP